MWRPKFRWSFEKNKTKPFFLLSASVEALTTSSIAGLLNFSFISRSTIGRYLIGEYISGNNPTNNFYGAIHLPWATCSSWVNAENRVVDEDWNYGSSLHTNKHSRQDCRAGGGRFCCYTATWGHKNDLSAVFKVTNHNVSDQRCFVNIS